jgi:hypothetical protein
MRFPGPLAAALLLLSTAVASAQGRWSFAPEAGEGPKFGYVAEAGSSNFFPFWIYCASDTKEIVINAYVGERWPAGGRGSFTLAAGSEPPVAVAGDVAAEAFDGLFTLEAKLPRSHALFTVLTKNQPMTYAGGTTRANLGTDGLTAVLQRWMAACR